MNNSLKKINKTIKKKYAKNTKKKHKQISGGMEKKKRELHMHITTDYKNNKKLEVNDLPTGLKKLMLTLIEFFKK